MKIFGIQFSIKKQPGPGARLSVIEESLAGHENILHTLVDRLVVVEKKAEATRRKVYRDGEEPEPSPIDREKEPAPTFSFDNLGPGDEIPPGVNL